MNEPPRPDAPRDAHSAPSPWKGVALAAGTAALLLAGTVVHLARLRLDDRAEAVRQRVEEQVRFHLAQGEPAKAAAALGGLPDDPSSREREDDLRLAIARRSPPAAAAALLDDVRLAGRDRTFAEPAARERLAAWRRLFESKVLQDGALPAPYELKPFRTDPVPEAPREELSRIVGRLLACLEESDDLAKRYGTDPDPDSPRLAALARAARYALGEIPFEAVRPVDDATRLRFGDLLFRERQFDRAIAVWKGSEGVLRDPSVQRRLAELAALRRLAPKRLRFWDYDLDALPARDPAIETEATACAEAIFRWARPAPRLLPAREIADPANPAREDLPAEDPAFVAAPEPPRLESASPAHRILLDDESFDRFRLETPTDRLFDTRTGASFRLTTAYRGPIRARLFRAPDLETLRAVDAETLPARRRDLVPVAEWETQFAPIWMNDMKPETQTLEVPQREPGFYVLAVDARYSPVVAVARFIVSDVLLVQQVAGDRVLIFAADRETGAPVPGLPLAGEIEGRYELRPEDLAPSGDAKADEHRRGLDAAWAGKAEEADATPSYRAGHRKGAALRESHPEQKRSFRGATGPDGLFEWTVAPAWTAGYRYAVRTATAGAPHYARVETPYAPDDRPALKALVYTDRPLYRPGDTVHFKAMLRRLGNEGLLPYDGREALVEISSRGRVIHAATLPATELGTLSGSFTLSRDADTGPYAARVNNGESQSVFEVEEYRKPELEIVFDHPAEVRAGEIAEVAIAVRDFTGGPVPGANVEIERIPEPPAEQVLADDLMRSWYAGAVAATRRSARAVEHRQLVTDAAGRCTYRFVTVAGFGRSYRLAATARERSGPACRRETRLEVRAPAAGISFETDRPAYLPGETARIRFRVAPPPGAAPTHLRVEETKTAEHPFAARVEIRDGTASIEYRVPDEDLQLKAAIRAGDEWVWTPVSLPVVRAGTSRGILDIRPDRSLYRVGETATISIRSADPDAHVLVVFATGRIHGRQVVALRGTEANVPWAVRAEDVPNVGVRALAVRGDRLEVAETRLLVPPSDRFLAVEIATDRDAYRPGETCRATVRVRDAAGRPVPGCELSLGVVDEAVYALHEDATPDLREYFHRYERRLEIPHASHFTERLETFRLWKAPLFAVGAAYFDSIGVGGGGGGRYGGRMGGKISRGGGGLATEGASARVRVAFRDTAFWTAHVKTDAEGSAVVSFPFPQNLTAFRFTARGLTRDTKVGSVTRRAVVRMPFYVRLAVPRVLQEGNTIALGGIVHNHTGRPQRVQAAFETPFPVLRTNVPDPWIVPPGGVEKAEILVSVDRFLPEARIAFGARCEDGTEDAMRLAVPGRRRGTPFREGRAGTIAAGGTAEALFRLPADAVPGTATLRLQVDPGLHAAIAEAVEPLIEYPYGCVEQTMSRFLPAVAAARALGGPPPRWREKLPSVLADGLLRLYRLQKADGGWSWWGDGTNEAMTAYVLYGLAQCRKAGVGVDRAAAERAATRVREELEKRLFGFGDPGPASRLPLPAAIDPSAYAALALAEYESAWAPAQPDATWAAAAKRIVYSLVSRDGPRSAIDETILALASLRLGLDDMGESLAKQAVRLPVEDVPTAAFRLQLQAARKGDAGEAARFLLARRAGRGFRTTMEGAHAVLGLAALLERGDPAAAPGTVTVLVNGTAVRTLVLPGKADPAFDGRVTLPEPDPGWGGRITVRLRFEGSGTAFYTASMEGVADAAAPEPVQRGLAVTREYLEETETGWRPADGRVRAGRRVLVHLAVTTPEKREYIMLEDPRPDGFEPSDSLMGRDKGTYRRIEGLTDRVDLAAGWNARLDAFHRDTRGDAARESAWGRALLEEILRENRFSRAARDVAFQLPPGARPASVDHRDDRTILFLDAIPAGTTHIYYVARPEFAGTFVARPPRAEPMYDPEIAGAGTPARLTVTGGALVPEPAAGLAPEPPAGVAGLRAVLPALDPVDADALAAEIPAQPRIGTLLMRVLTEPALRAWLGAAPETEAAAGAGLRDRIAAARRDIATRRLAAEALGEIAPRPDWLPAIEEALRDEELAGRVLDATAAAPEADADALDNALLWAREDRALRLALLATLLKWRGTPRLDGLAIRPVTVARVLARLGDRAPAGDARVHWLLAQRVSLEGGSLREVLSICERDLGLSIRAPADMPAGGSSVMVHEAPVAEALDKALAAAGLHWRLINGVLHIGRLEDLAR